MVSAVSIDTAWMTGGAVSAITRGYDCVNIDAIVVAGIAMTGQAETKVGVKDDIIRLAVAILVVAMMTVPTISCLAPRVPVGVKTVYSNCRMVCVNCSGLVMSRVAAVTACTIRRHR